MIVAFFFWLINLAGRAGVQHRTISPSKNILNDTDFKRTIPQKILKSRPLIPKGEMWYSCKLLRLLIVAPAFINLGLYKKSGEL